MSILGSIIDRIFHHASTDAPRQQTSGAGSSASTQQQQRPSAAQTSGATAGNQPKLQNVDVQAVLTQAAATKGGGGNWQTSIVDLLKLLDLDSSLSARRELANELNVHAGADGTAEQNIALQKAVMGKLAENGGKVPDSLRH
ncbi:MAG TPA: DUF3597 domain-containing protein [Casimicrobiaceae bacterium]|jgi:hypothetical protein